MVMPWLPWFLIGAAALIIGIAALRAARRGERAPVGPTRRVANAMPLLRSPAVLRRLRRRRALHALLGALIIVAMASSALLAGRPVSKDVRNDALASRDIVLCLDVSGSMLGLDSQVLETYTELIDSFNGERVALIAWNTTAQTMVPLTDDYETLKTEMGKITDLLDSAFSSPSSARSRYSQMFAGTMAEELDASSLAGDGLASCTQAFDNSGAASADERPRSIILATDNLVFDDSHVQLYSLPEAAELATSKKIRLFSIYGYDDELDYGDLAAQVESARRELETATQDNGGKFYQVGDSGTAGRIVEELEKTQVQEYSADNEVRLTDTPRAGAVWLVLAAGSLLLIAAWRRA